MRLAFLSDIHFGREQDLNAWDFACQLLAAVKVDRVFLGGDIFDTTAASDYIKTLKDEDSLQGEIDEGKAHLAELVQVLPKAQFQFYLGNHEERIERLIKSKVRALASLRAIQPAKLFDLDDLGIQTLPCRKPIKVGHLYLAHGHEFATGGASPAHTALNSVNSNILFGHVHRVSVSHKRQLDGRLIGAWSNSCLSSLQPEYTKPRPDWTQGFTLVDFTKSGNFRVSPVIFWGEGEELLTIIDGKEYAKKGK